MEIILIIMTTIQKDSNYNKYQDFIMKIKITVIKLRKKIAVVKIIVIKLRKKIAVGGY